MRRAGAAVTLAAMATCLHSFSWAPQSPDDLRSIRCPVLLVTGKQDHLIHDAALGARYISGARIVEIDGGHAANEENPGRTNDAIMSFLRE